MRDFFRTKKGTKVFVSLVADVDPNEGGWYVEIYPADGKDMRIDDMCVHPEDCDCSNDEEVDACIQRYLDTVTEY